MKNSVSEAITYDDDSEISEIETWHICKVCNAMAFIDPVKLLKHQENHNYKETSIVCIQPDEVSIDQVGHQTSGPTTTNVIIDHNPPTPSQSINRASTTTGRGGLRQRDHSSDDKLITEDKEIRKKPKLKLVNNKRRKRTLKAETCFACKKCEKKFSKSCSLALHYRLKHHGQGTSNCVCGRSFSASQFFHLHSLKCSEFIKTKSKSLADNEKNLNGKARPRIYLKSTRSTSRRLEKAAKN